MADIKFQVFRGEASPDHVDFRGDGFLGSPEDEHRTFLEIEDADESTVEAVLMFGPELNEVFDKLTSRQPDALSAVASALGLSGSGDLRLAIRVYDE